MHNLNDSYWKIPNVKGPEETFIKKGEGNKNIYSLYICDTCKVAFGHPLSYCPSCPGKMVKVKDMTYDQFVETLTGFEWGESKLWDGRRQQRNRLESLESKKEPIPCVLTLWPWYFKKDETEDGQLDENKLRLRLEKEYGTNNFTLNKIDLEHRVEVKIPFNSFKEFIDFFYDEKGMSKSSQYRLEPA